MRQRAELRNLAASQSNFHGLPTPLLRPFQHARARRVVARLRRLGRLDPSELAVPAAPLRVAHAAAQLRLAPPLSEQRQYAFTRSISRRLRVTSESP